MSAIAAGGERPLVSAIIPVYNARQTLGGAAASVLSQPGAEVELILVDDGSTDGSLEVIENLAAGDERVHAVRQGNSGASAARNRGLDEARGEYVYFLDADDVALPGALASLVAAERRSGTGAAVGGYDTFSEAHGSLMLCDPPGSPLESLGLHEVIRSNVIATISQIIRRDAIGDMRFDTRFSCYEDQDMWLRLAERGVRWAIMRRRVARYRMRPGSLSKSASILRCAEQVISAAQRRTGAMTGEELRVRLGDLALGYATRAAIVHADPAAEVATSIFAEASARLPIEAAQGAAAGHAHAIHGLGIWPSPDAEVGGHRLLKVLESWWRACAGRGWMNERDVTVAGEEFSRLCVHPGRVAAELLHGLDGGVTIAGWGRNARWLAKAASDRGLAAFVRDDRFAGGDARAEELPPGVVAEAMAAPVPVGRQVVISPLDDQTLASRYPEARRWRVVRDRLAEGGNGDGVPLQPAYSA
jgi:hypothetical protein